MKTLILFISLVFMAPQTNLNTTKTVQNNPTDLIGTWKIDLRPTAESEPYYQMFVIKNVKGKSFSGTFYSSKITEAKLNTNWGKLIFGFTTSDGTNDYYHSGYLEDGKVHGITYCPNRDMAAPWTGTKE